MAQSVFEASEAWVRSRDAAAEIERQIAELQERLAVLRATEAAARLTLESFVRPIVERAQAASRRPAGESPVVEYLRKLPPGDWASVDEVLSATVEGLEVGSEAWKVERAKLINRIADYRRRHNGIIDIDPGRPGHYRLTVANEKAEGGDPPPA